MNLLGHIAFSYIFSKLISLDEHIRLSFIWFFGILPDIDVLIPGLPHRGITHSIALTLILTPFLIMIFKQDILIYILSILSHQLIDIAVSFHMTRSQILWPLNKNWIRLSPLIIMNSNIEINIEITLLLIMMIMIIFFKDYKIIKKFKIFDYILILFTIIALFASGYTNTYFNDNILLPFKILFIIFNLTIHYYIHIHETKELDF
jgi:hypothetical protein